LRGLCANDGRADKIAAKPTNVKLRDLMKCIVDDVDGVVVMMLMLTNVCWGVENDVE